MKKVLFVLFTLLSFNAYSQKHLVGISMGMNTSSIGSNAIFNNPSFRPGILSGLTYEYVFGNKITVGGGLQYSQRGFRQEITFTDAFGQSLGVAKSDVRWDYLALPLQAGYMTGDRIFAFGYLGLVPAYLMRASTSTPVQSQGGDIVAPDPVENTGSFSRFDLSGRAELGAGYKLTSKYWLSCSVAFQQSFTPTGENGFFNDVKLSQYGFNFGLGLRYALN